MLCLMSKLSPGALCISSEEPVGPQPTLLATILHYGVSLNPTSAPNATASSPPVRDMPLESGNWLNMAQHHFDTPAPCGFHAPPFAGALLSPG